MNEYRSKHADTRDHNAIPFRGKQRFMPTKITHKLKRQIERVARQTQKTQEDVANSYGLSFKVTRP